MSDSQCLSSSKKLCFHNYKVMIVISFTNIYLNIENCSVYVNDKDLFKSHAIVFFPFETRSIIIKETLRSHHALS